MDRITIIVLPSAGSSRRENRVNTGKLKAAPLAPSDLGG
jgi:hypothetical protein